MLDPKASGNVWFWCVLACLNSYRKNSIISFLYGLIENFYNQYVFCINHRKLLPEALNVNERYTQQLIHVRLCKLERHMYLSTCICHTAITGVYFWCPVCAHQISSKSVGLFIDIIIQYSDFGRKFTFPNRWRMCVKNYSWILSVRLPWQSLVIICVVWGKNWAMATVWSF